ncbi:hypothetical protein HNR44_000903 [Geomicrobium halophilum]|uniref:DUF327 domain-containing protein n=1 Tax=Geomicrobium halophilum TaxID=549000 RepID=A0A841PMK5_9BACL|nr:YaaR family protein [Geomicrobium halophilum]MBB6448954.1 hypothetical protein [Geomicrobium halophilum]
MNIERSAKMSLPLHILKKPARSVSNGQNQPSFKEIMDQQRQTQHFDRLQAMMNKIEDQGKLLAEFRTIEELRKYKKLVKDFVEETVQKGFYVKDRYGMNRRAYKVVDEVDTKLIKLTTDVIENETNHLQILEQVGEIRGMLMNLYI